MIGLPKLEQMLVQADSTLREAMMVIESNAQGICFVVSKEKLVGVITDGDIRRALLKGMEIEGLVADVMQKNYISIETNTSIEKIQALLKGAISHIPIINSNGELVDYACASRYHQVPLTQPMLDGNELEYITDCICSGWISSQGKYVQQFEELFSDYVQGVYALAVSNGTVALHLALATLGVGPGDEVIIPDLTFAAPVNATIYVGATPVLVDIDPNTLCIDIAALQKAITPKTKAIIPVHLYGHPADMHKIMEIARDSKLYVIEDCAEAIGSVYKGKHVGSYGDASIFSFFGNKTITTGEGGMLLFREPAFNDRARMLRDHGMSKQRRYWHEEVGFNYRMTNIQAAIGVAQLERIHEFVERKRWIAELYHDRLLGIDGLRLPGDFGDVINSYWLYTFVLPEDLTAHRNNIIDVLLKNGIEVRTTFYPVHQMPPYKKYMMDKNGYPVSEYISSSGISLPSAYTMEESDINRVCAVLSDAIRQYRT